MKEKWEDFKEKIHWYFTVIPHMLIYLRDKFPFCRKGFFKIFSPDLKYYFEKWDCPVKKFQFMVLAHFISGKIKKSPIVLFGFKDYLFIWKARAIIMWILLNPFSKRKKWLQELNNFLDWFVEHVYDQIESENPELRLKLKEASKELKEINNMKTWYDIDKMLDNLTERFLKKTN